MQPRFYNTITLENLFFCYGSWAYNVYGNLSEDESYVQALENRQV